MNKEELISRFNFVDNEVNKMFTMTRYQRNLCAEFAIEYSNTQNALLKKELEEAKAEIERMRIKFIYRPSNDFTNDFPCDDGGE